MKQEKNYTVVYEAFSSGKIFTKHFSTLAKALDYFAEGVELGLPRKSYVVDFNGYQWAFYSFETIQAAMREKSEQLIREGA